MNRMLSSIALASLVSLALAHGALAEPPHAPPHAPPEVASLTMGQQAPARLTSFPPLADPLAMGLVILPYRVDNVRIVPVFGQAALDVSPRIGHLHVTLDGAPWHWVDASNEPIVIQGLAPGAHRVLIELADSAHKVLDSKVVSFEVPGKPSK